MGVLEKELLMRAMDSEIGIELESESPERDFMRLSQERTKNRDFKSLTIRREPQGRQGVIWVVKLRAALCAEALADDFVKREAGS